MSWTVILPAAGRGTRLGYSGPKALFPVAGKSILDHLVQRFKPVCSVITLVTSPERPIPIWFQGMSVEQASPDGMADAVGAGLAFVTTPYVCVCWGDQIVTSDTLIQRCMCCVEIHKADMACPVHIVKDPYVAFKRGYGGNIVKVLQRREGDVMPNTGESDFGLFFFRTGALREVVGTYMDIGKVTHEYNFVPLLPQFQKQASVLGKREDVLGINTIEEAKQAEEILACR